MSVNNLDSQDMCEKCPWFGWFGGKAGNHECPELIQLRSEISQINICVNNLTDLVTTQIEHYQDVMAKLAGIPVKSCNENHIVPRGEFLNSYLGALVKMKKRLEETLSENSKSGIKVPEILSDEHLTRQQSQKDAVNNRLAFLASHNLSIKS